MLHAQQRPSAAHSTVLVRSRCTQHSLLKKPKMAATVERIVTAPDIDVFTLPHSKMRKLIVDTAQEVYVFLLV